MFLYVDPTTNSVADLVSKFNKNLKTIADKFDAYTGLSRISESFIATTASASYDTPKSLMPTLVSDQEHIADWETANFDFSNLSWTNITDSVGVRKLIEVTGKTSYTFILHSFMYKFWVICGSEVTYIPPSGLTLDLSENFYIFAKDNENGNPCSSANFLVNSISWFKTAEAPHYLELFSVPSSSTEANFTDVHGTTFIADEIIKQDDRSFFIKRLRRIVLDGVTFKATEIHNTSGLNYFVIPIGPFGYDGIENTSIDFVSSHFTPSFTKTMNSAYLDTVGFNIVVFPSAIYSSVEDFNNILNEKFVSGCPVEFIVREPSANTIGTLSIFSSTLGNTDYSVSQFFTLKLGEFVQGTNSVEVYRNGIRLRNLYDYTEVGSNCIYLRSVSKNDIVLISYDNLSNVSLDVQQTLIDVTKETYNLTEKLNSLLPKFYTALSDVNTYSTITSIQAKTTQSLVRDLNKLYNEVSEKLKSLNERYSYIDSELTSYSDLFLQVRKCLDDFNSLLEKYEQSDSLKVRVIEAHFTDNWSTTKPYTYNFVSDQIPAIQKAGFISPVTSDDYEVLQKVISIDSSHNTLTLHADERLPEFDAYIILYL